jgi:hypothetical protein
MNYRTRAMLGAESTVDNVYLNVVLDHPDYVPVVNGPTGPNFPTALATNETPINAEYNVTKTEALLQKCSDFYCSVVRFTIPLDETPLLICPIIPNQGNPNLTPLIIGIEYNGSASNPGIYFPNNIIYVSSNISYPPPQQISFSQIVTPYYFVFSYKSFIDLINTALLASWVNSGLAAALPNYVPPYFYLDAVTNLINVVLPIVFNPSPASAIGTPKIFMNAVLQNYLDTFNLKFTGFDMPHGNDVYLNVVNVKPENYYYPNGVTVPTPVAPTSAVPTLPYYLRFAQEYSVLEYWTSLRKIIITTNAIPVRNEYLPVANNTVNANIDSGGGNVSYPILSDFVPNIDTSAGSSRSIAYYVPSAQYRLIDLQSDTALQTIDIRMYWLDLEGNIYPIQISILQQASVKLLFTRKSLYKNHNHTLEI